MPLTDSEITALAPKDKSYKCSDGRSLYLLEMPSGGKLWRLNYRFEGKQKTLSFGAWPIVTIEDARRKSIETKHLLVEGVDPGTIRTPGSTRRKSRNLNSFDKLADEFLQSVL